MSTYKDMLAILYSILYKKHPGVFDKVLELKGEMRRSIAIKRSYFSTSKYALDEPKRITGSKYFVETRFNANATVKLCKELLRLFGHEERELGIFVSPVAVINGCLEIEHFSN